MDIDPRITRKSFGLNKRNFPRTTLITFRQTKINYKINHKFNLKKTIKNSQLYPFNFSLLVLLLSFFLHFSLPLTSNPQPVTKLTITGSHLGLLFTLTPELNWLRYGLLFSFDLSSLI